MTYLYLIHTKKLFFEWSKTAYIGYDDEKEEKCALCGTGIKHIYEIENWNGDKLKPIGGTCMEIFQNPSFKLSYEEAKKQSNIAKNNFIKEFNLKNKEIILDDFRDLKQYLTRENLQRYWDEGYFHEDLENDGEPAKDFRILSLSLRNKEERELVWDKKERILFVIENYLKPELRKVFDVQAHKKHLREERERLEQERLRKEKVEQEERLRRQRKFEEEQKRKQKEQEERQRKLRIQKEREERDKVKSLKKEIDSLVKVLDRDFGKFVEVSFKNSSEALKVKVKLERKILDCQIAQERAKNSELRKNIDLTRSYLEQFEGEAIHRPLSETTGRYTEEAYEVLKQVVYKIRNGEIKPVRRKQI